MHLLTNLAKRLKGKSTWKFENSEIFGDVFKQNTLRIVCSRQFLDFAYDFAKENQEIYEKFLIPGDYNFIWMEIDEWNAEMEEVYIGSVEEIDWLLEKKPTTVILSKIAFFVSKEKSLSWYGENKSNGHFLYFDRIKYPTTPDEQNHSWIIGAARVTYFAMKNLPDRAFQNEKMFVSVPEELINKNETKELPFFNYVYFRSLPTKTKNGLSGIDKHGVRWHWVRPHNMLPRGHKEPVLRKGHYRGDASIGIIRRVLVGST